MVMVGWILLAGEGGVLEVDDLLGFMVYGLKLRV